MTAPMVAPVEARFKATGVSEVQRGLRLVGSAGETTGRQVGGSMRQIAGGVEMIARQGKVTGESLKSIIAQGAEMAFMFGAAGPIVGALGIVGVAIYEHITRGMKEAQEEAVKLNRQIESMNLGGAGSRQQQLYSGNRFALRDPGESNAAFIARQQGIQGLRGRIGTLAGQLPAGARDRAMADAQAFAIGSVPWTERPGKVVTEMIEMFKALDKLRGEYNLLVPTTERLAAAEGDRAKTGVKLAADAEALLNAPLSQTHPMAWAAALRRANADAANDPMALLRRMGVQMTPGGSSGLYTTPIGGADGHRTFGIKPADITNPIKDQILTPAQEILRQGMSSTIGDSISQGIREGFQQGSIGTALTAGGKALLSGIGQMIQQEGEVWIKYGVLKLALFDSLFKDPVGSGASAIAKGGLLVALGASISSVWGGRGGGGSSGGGGGSYSASAITHYGNIDPTISGASGITPRNAVANYVTIIGTDSPEAQRAFDELQRKSRARGSLG